MDMITSWVAGLWDWATGQSSSGQTFSFDNPSGGSGDGSGDGSSPIFSYVLIGAAVLLLVAVIFGELEDVA